MKGCSDTRRPRLEHRGLIPGTKNIPGTKKEVLTPHGN